MTNIRFHENIYRIQLLGLLQKQGWWNVKHENYTLIKRTLIIIRTVFVDTRLQ